MNRLHVLAGQLVQVEVDVDDQGYTAADPILPPIKEIFIQGAASLIIFAALWKFALPAIKRALRNRSERIQSDLDGATSAVTDADTSATDIRAALGDIDGERQRLFAEADLQVESILADGRRRLDEEIADLHARADADIVMAASRSGDELRTEIGRHAAAGLEAVVAQTLDDATQQELIENFIQRVGVSGTGVGTS
jgi:F-type H+-transporting ATPase subunit b